MATSVTDTTAPTHTARTVFVRIMFLRIGEIDTLNEKYQAQAAIESRWPVELDQLTADLPAEDQKRLSEGRSISLVKYAERHWHPHIFLENTRGDPKEQIRYSAKISREDNQVYVHEHRDVKGWFWEKLELQHFPCDTQDLSISVSSTHCNDRVVLLPDPCYLSGVNREAFVDQQEWKLYAHVDVLQRSVDEYNYFSEDVDDLEGADVLSDRQRTIVTATCYAARWSDYFFWNGYCLIFLITAISYACYFVPPQLLMHRLQTTCTLLLTSITFRWTVNKSLPTISYLTSMDAYAIVCIFALVINALWHTLIGAVVFETTAQNTTARGAWHVTLDRIAFLISFGLFIVGNALFALWVYLVPLKVRRKLEAQDATLLRTKSERRKSSRVSKDLNNGETPSKFQRIPIE